MALRNVWIIFFSGLSSDLKDDPCLRGRNKGATVRVVGKENKKTKDTSPRGESWSPLLGERRRRWTLHFDLVRLTFSRCSFVTAVTSAWRRKCAALSRPAFVMNPGVRSSFV